MPTCCQEEEEELCSTAPSSAAGWGCSAVKRSMTQGLQQVADPFAAVLSPQSTSNMVMIYLGSPESRMNCSSYSCERGQQKYQLSPWIFPLPPPPSVLSLVTSLMLLRFFCLLSARFLPLWRSWGKKAEPAACFLSGENTGAAVICFNHFL